MVNGLTPMGLVCQNQQHVKRLMGELSDRLKSQKKACSSDFRVLTVLNDTHCFKTAVMGFISEHDAIEYQDKFNQSGKGYARLIG